MYTAEVTPESLTFAVDGTTYFTYANDQTCNVETWPFAQRFNFILNIAVGGGFGGYCLNGQAPTFSDTNREMDGSNYREMEVDWVRVSQKRNGYQDPCAVYTRSPTPAPASGPMACHTARVDDVDQDCYHDVDWAMGSTGEGIHLYPDWYPGLTPQSSFEEFQAVVYQNQLGDPATEVTCQMPCTSSPTPEPTTQLSFRPTLFWFRFASVCFPFLSIDL